MPGVNTNEVASSSITATPGADTESLETPFPITQASKVDKISQAVKLVLGEIGEGQSRERLQKTPARAAKAVMVFAEVYHLSPVAILQDATFQENHRGMDLLKDANPPFAAPNEQKGLIQRWIHVAYIPDERIFGLSKIPRAVKVLARRLQVLERLTTQVARCIDEALRPRGVAVVAEATHLCMAMRGIEQERVATTTMCFLGQFDGDERARQDFWKAVGR